MSLRTAERIGALPRPAAERHVESVGQTAARMRALMLTSALILFLVALYPRAINLSGYLTTDEGNWMGRTALFTRALLNGDPAGTYQSGHPGVMTMWSSLLGPMVSVRRVCSNDCSATSEAHHRRRTSRARSWQRQMPRSPPGMGSRNWT